MDIQLIQIRFDVKLNVEESLNLWTNMTLGEHKKRAAMFIAHLERHLMDSVRGIEVKCTLNGFNPMIQVVVERLVEKDLSLFEGILAGSIQTHLRFLNEETSI